MLKNFCRVRQALKDRLDDVVSYHLRLWQSERCKWLNKEKSGS